MISGSLGFSSSASRPSSAATKKAASESTTWLTAAIIPKPISFFIKVVAGILNSAANSFTVASNGIVTFFLVG